MATVWQASVEDLYRVDGKAELVDGEIVRMHAGGDDHGSAAGAVYASLLAYARRTGHGRAYPDNTGFLCNLPHRKSFSPDAAFYDGPRAGKKFLPRPPLFAVEVRSDQDYGAAAERRLARKRADYFAAGTQVVWVVDLDAEDVIRVYRANSSDQPDVYGRGQTAEAEPAVPGWKFEVDELFR